MCVGGGGGGTEEGEGGEERKSGQGFLLFGFLHPPSLSSTSR